jgi:hypothetical protein
MLKSTYFFRRVATGAAVALATCVLVHASVPRGWFLAGTKPAEYEAGIDAGQPYQGHASAFLKSRTLSVDGFGTLMQSVRAERYIGKRVRISGLVKSREVMSWAGLWMRVNQGKNILRLTACKTDPSKARQTGSVTTWFWMSRRIRLAYHLGFYLTVQGRFG